ncbi:MAG: lysophospholipid acyltransferase family protein, partial [Flavobacteriales bacterium]
RGLKSDEMTTFAQRMRLFYYIFRCLTGIFHVLPFRLIYLKSILISFALYRLIAYRRKVVWANIFNAFPEKTQAERKWIEKAFYRNLGDIILEGIKGFSIRKKVLRERFCFKNPEVLDHWFETGVSIVAVGAHYANWEWGVMAAPMFIKHKPIAFYTPLTNPFVNEYMCTNRSKFGTEMVPTNKIKDAISASGNTPVLWFFGADQSPSNIKSVHWMKFLNQETACNRGAEFFARRYGLPVVYFDVQRIRRGYYEVEIRVLFDNAANTSAGEVTTQYFHTLEQIIRAKPEDYLWSHRRWKHKRETMVD